MGPFEAVLGSGLWHRLLKSIFEEPFRSIFKSRHFADASRKAFSHLKVPLDDVYEAFCGCSLKRIGYRGVLMTHLQETAERRLTKNPL